MARRCRFAKRRLPPCASGRSCPTEAAASPSRSSDLDGARHARRAMKAHPNTTDLQMESWLPVSAGSDFPIRKPAVRRFRARREVARIGVAIGDLILDLRSAAEAGLLDDICERELLCAPVLNPLLAAGSAVWSPLRERLCDLLRAGRRRASARGRSARLLRGARSTLTMLVPMDVGDYVDFYSSIEHATNLGRLFRPNAEPLLPNWRWTADRISRPRRHDRRRHETPVHAPERAAQSARRTGARVRAEPRAGYRARGRLRHRAGRTNSASRFP